ncbi:MAG: type IV secretion protein IcmE, partial [Legionellales bacterium RIFCSPHIGHO2_12_FULL_42_9]
ERALGVSAALIKRNANCSVEALKAAGFSASELKIAGFSASDLKAAGFSANDLRSAGFKISDLKSAGFTASDLLNAGFARDDLLQAGFDAATMSAAAAAAAAAEAALPPGITHSDITAAGCDVEALSRELAAGVNAKTIQQDAGCNAAALKQAGFTDAALSIAGFSKADIAAGIPITDKEISLAGCDPSKLHELSISGVSAQQIRRINGCGIDALKQAGFGVKALSAAGFTQDELLAAHFTPQQLRAAGVSSQADGRESMTTIAALQAAKSNGMSASALRENLAVSAAALKAAGFTAAELKAAGFTAAELKAAGFSAEDLKNAGYNAKELYEAGFSAKTLKDAGFAVQQLYDAGIPTDTLKQIGFSEAQLKNAEHNSANLLKGPSNAKEKLAELKTAGYTAKDLRDNGFNADALKRAGFTARQLRDAGFSADELRNAGFTGADLKQAGYSDSEIKAADDLDKGLKALKDQHAQNSLGLGDNNSVQSLSLDGRAGGEASIAAANTQHLQDLLKEQKKQYADQNFKQQIQQRSSAMNGIANTFLQRWRDIGVQNYVTSAQTDAPSSSEDPNATGQNTANAGATSTRKGTGTTAGAPEKKALLKTGDIIFAVLDTTVNTDEPSPILATVVSGRFSGAKLIGSFNLPPNSDKMVISFNVMSVPGAAKSTAINAYAIDANTARTALSGHADYHYLLRYGSLFASSFLEGFGNAFQSANTTVTIGGTSGGNNVTVQNGIGRSALQNAIIGLSTLGKDWGTVAQQNINRPITVEVYAGTPLGILFTKDLVTL